MWYFYAVMMILFVCRANLNRSPRAAEVFKRLASAVNLDIEVISAGTNTPDYSVEKPEVLERVWGVKETTQLTPDLLRRANKIIALDSFVIEEMVNLFGVESGSVINLEIPDHFSKSRGNLDGLYQLLEEKLTPLVREASILFGSEGGVGKERR